METGLLLPRNYVQCVKKIAAIWRETHSEEDEKHLLPKRFINIPPLKLRSNIVF